MTDQRCRLQGWHDRHMSAQEAAGLIQKGLTVGMSGFTQAGEAEDEALAIMLLTGASPGNDQVHIKVRDEARSRASVLQRKTGRDVKFELTEQTRVSVEAWIAKAALRPSQFDTLIKRVRTK